MPKFWFVSRGNSLFAIGDRHWQKLAATFDKAESANSLPFAQQRVPFHVGCLFRAYKRDEVVVIKMGAYIHGVLILCGCLLSRFYGNCNPTSLHHLTYKCMGVNARSFTLYHCM